MPEARTNLLRWLFDGRHGPAGRLIPRWIFLRALAAIYLSAFYSLLFQIRGLIGPGGILPAGHYLASVAHSMSGVERYWYAPSLFWLSSSSGTLMAVTGIGLAASVAALLNLWPRLSLLVCWISFLSFVAAAGEFSSYQSDGMLLEAGFLALFFAPRGLMPGWGAADPPSRAALWLLQWEWFRIYLESGMVKLLSGDREWRDLTAMDEYYQNSPLPTWIGWYVEHLPHWFHRATALGTLVMELGIVWMLFLPRRARLICFLIVTPWEIGVILTGNYAFLNYLVLSLGLLLLDDRSLTRFVPARLRPPSSGRVGIPPPAGGDPPHSIPAVPDAAAGEREPEPALRSSSASWAARPGRRLGLVLSAVMLTWIGYATTAQLIAMPFRVSPLPRTPVALLEPFRIANQYGLFAVMTHGRYEIEFQGSNDGREWTPYLFVNKPQLVAEAPRIYAPYQPRFDWNLWFASLADWQEGRIVSSTEERLLDNSPEVLSLFRANPFPSSPPHFVRAVLWRYRFTSIEDRRRSGDWWRRELVGVYVPELARTPEGHYVVVAWPDELPPHE